MDLIEKIEDAEHYIREFKTWEATEQIIDNDKAFWMLRKPGSEYRKVCLYRDGCKMFVYGDYGQFTFDSMTWLGDVYNLEYDNIGYQMEKLDYNSRLSLNVFDDNYCCDDIIDWLKDRLECSYRLGEDEIEKVVAWIKECEYDCYPLDIEEFCDKNGLDEIKDILDFTNDCFSNTDEYEWISFLRNNSNTLDDFDEAYESNLWNAGKRIHRRYFVNMYALQVCGEKLKKQKGEKMCLKPKRKN